MNRRLSVPQLAAAAVLLALAALFLCGNFAVGLS